ncbi:hypothetical protein [Singulisphaera sp. PoT]|uniref:hypothetical protein n=1 Tax=Singulisphaera sp. PoT TaxID=3411797 RepID=UPI003BF4C1BF
MSIEKAGQGELDELHKLMSISFENSEFLYLQAKRIGVSDPVILVATSDGRTAAEKSAAFDGEEAYRSLLEGAVIRRRIASDSIEPITVTVFPREVLSLRFEESGHPDLAETIDMPATQGKMTLLLMKADDYRFVERDAPGET